MQTRNGTSLAPSYNLQRLGPEACDEPHCAPSAVLELDVPEEQRSAVLCGRHGVQVDVPRNALVAVEVWIVGAARGRLAHCGQQGMASVKRGGLDGLVELARDAGEDAADVDGGGLAVGLEGVDCAWTEAERGLEPDGDRLREIDRGERWLVAGSSGEGVWKLGCPYVPIEDEVREDGVERRNWHDSDGDDGDSDLRHRSLGRLHEGTDMAD